MPWSVTPRPLPVAGALGTSTVTLFGGRGTWWHRPPLGVAGVALLALGWLWWCAWSRLVRRDAAVFCVAGVALGDIHGYFVWQAWHLWHWAWWHRLTPTSFTQTAFRHLHRSRTYFFQYINSQTFSHATFSHRTLSPDLSSTISFLFLAFPIPSSPFFCYLLEEV